MIKSIRIADLEPSSLVTFQCGGQTAVVIDLKTGKVTLAEHMTPDEAARVFWQAVEASFHFKQETT